MSGAARIWRRSALGLLAVGLVALAGAGCGSQPSSSPPSSSQPGLTKPIAPKLGRNGAVISTFSGGLAAVNPNGSPSSDELAAVNPDGSHLRLIEPIKPIKPIKPQPLISPDGTMRLTENGVLLSAGRDRRQLVPSDEIELPVWSPDSGSIAYLSSGGVWNVDVTSGKRTQLVKGDYLGKFEWSPDSRRLFVLTYDEDDIEVVQADGSGKHTIITGVASWAEHSWALSPDGKYIAYLREFKWTGKLLLVDTEGHGPRLVTPSLEEWAWSPDGRSIAYTASEGSTAEPRSPLVVVAIPSLRRSVLARPVSGAPAWSPDGKLIAVAKGDPSDIWLYSPTGSVKRRITPGYLSGQSFKEPFWEPRGLRSEQLPGKPLPTGGIAVCRVSGSSVTVPADNSALAVDGSSVTVPADISALAVDGNTVAWETQGDIEAWRVGTPRVVPLPAEESASDVGWIQVFAVADGRVAWLSIDESNHVYSSIYAARVARPIVKSLFGITDADVVGPVAGHCGFAWVVVEGGGWKLLSEHAGQLAAGWGNVRALLGDGTHIAVFRSDGRVVIVDGAKHVARIEGADRHASHALTRSYFVSLENGSLRLWSLKTGAAAGTRSFGGRDLKTLNDGEGNRLLVTGADGVFLYDLSRDSWTRLAEKGSWAGFVRGGVVYRTGNKLVFLRR